MSNYFDPYKIIDGTGSVETIEHTIQGQSVLVDYRVPDTVYSTFHADDIKKILVQKLTETLYNSNFIEFTKSTELSSSETIFRARIFVVSNSDVKLLREKKIIK
jgi:hypothetical protein